MDKTFAQTTSYKVYIEGKKINVDLYSIVYSEQEVLRILDAYQKAVYARLEDEGVVRPKIIIGATYEYEPPKK